MAQHNLLVGPMNTGSTKSKASRVLPYAAESNEEPACTSSQTQRRDQGSETDKRRLIYFSVILLSVLITGILTGFLVNELTRNTKTYNHSTATVSNVTTKEELLTIDPLAFLPYSTTDKIAYTPYSPQAQAWDWLQQHPEIDDMQTWRKRQLMGLATLYYATGGDAYWEPSKWLDNSIHECEWEHSDCSVDNKYTGLALIDHNLHGTLTPELALLTSLHDLILWDNPKLQGPIPSELGLLNRLSHLAVVNSQLEGSFPPRLGSWQTCLI